MLTLADVWEGLIGWRPTWEHNPPVGRVVIDSRQAEEGSLFVALKGERQDGHDFAADACRRGAIAIIAEERVRERGLEASYVHVKAPPSVPPPPPICFLVDDSLAALQRLAAFWRRRHTVRVVGVTGSVGKTTTKELIYSVLSQRFRALRSEGNYNNEIGLPLTLLNLEPQHERVVLEMGMYALGEIAQLADIALPSIGVVTNVGPVHLERLGTIERIAQAKAELVEALPPDGVAVLNADDPRVREMAAKTRAQVFYYGLTPAADLWASDVESQGLAGIRFRLHHKGEVVHAKLPLLGRHSVHAALAAAAVGLVEGETWEEIIAGFQSPARLRLVAVSGPEGTTILDDTYNASPASTIAALNLLAELPGRRIAVLGDMLELGSFEEEGHRKVGRRAVEVAQKLVAVGQRGRIIGQEALRCGMREEDVFFAQDNQEAIAYLRRIIAPGDFILVKGSRGMRMEEIVNALAESSS